MVSENEQGTETRRMVEVEDGRQAAHPGDSFRGNGAGLGAGAGHAVGRAIVGLVSVGVQALQGGADSLQLAVAGAIVVIAAADCGAACGAGWRPGAINGYRN